MAIEANFYMHDSDRTALQALQAIPGFTPLLKAFMKVWNEKQFRIQNMSSNLRINERQMPKYHEMLVPICEKLGIEVPELYLKLDVVPNAWTYGDTKPFIVITSGLLEAMPEELIPTVLAHECGHIACHHCLYTTMGNLLFNGAASILGLSQLVTVPIQIAFYYWMRCSEYSADRAAALYEGTSDKIVEMCMRFSGLDKDLGGGADIESFMEQAVEYREMVSDSKWNRALEFLMLSDADHPLNAVRAYECREWANTDRFRNISAYLTEASATDSPQAIAVQLGEVLVPNAAAFYVGKNYREVSQLLQDLGFTHLVTQRTTEKKLLTQSGQTTSVSIDGKEDFAAWSWHPVNATVLVTYYEPPTPDEIANSHGGKLQLPNSPLFYLGRNYREVEKEFLAAGFRNVATEPLHKARKGFLDREGGVVRVTVNGQTQFDRSTWVHRDARVLIVYNTFTA